MIKYLLGKLGSWSGLFDQNEVVQALKYDIEWWKIEHLNLRHQIRKLEHDRRFLERMLEEERTE